jgi:hypothetical protein
VQTPRSTAQTGILIAALFLAGLVPLLTTPVLPLIDFYNHLARFFVLAHIDANPVLQSNYQTHWSLMPDIGGDIVFPPILRLVPSSIGGHVIAIMVLAVLYGGVLYLNRVLTGRVSLPVAVLLLPLLYSYIFNWGFTNFLLGLGLAFWAAGWWFRHREQPGLAIPVGCIFALLVFFAHGVAFVLYGVMIACLETGAFLNAGARKGADLVRALAQMAVQAVIPLGLFIFWKLAAVSHPAAALAAVPRALPPGASVPAGYFSLYRLGTILRVEESHLYWFDIATFAAQAAIIAFLVWRGRLLIAKLAWPGLVVAVVMIAIVPSMAFGAWYISDRVPLFAALFLLSALSPSSIAWTGESRIACLMLGVIACIRIGVVAINWHGYGDRYAEFQSVAEKIPAGSRLMGVSVGAGHHETDIPRCQMYAHLAVTQYALAAPLFSDKSLHPLVLAGALKQADDRLRMLAPVPPDERTTDFNPYMTAAIAAGYQYLLVCNVQLLSHPLPENLVVVARTPNFALLRSKAAPSL